MPLEMKCNLNLEWSTSVLIAKAGDLIVSRGAEERWEKEMER